MLQLCGSYLFQGGSQQIGANGTARVCFMSQHAAQAWASHHRLSLASTPISYMMECRPFHNLKLSNVYVAEFYSISHQCKKFCMHAVGFTAHLCPSI